MKNANNLLIIIAFALLSFHSTAQQVISTAGGYHETESLSISWTLGEPVVNTLTGNNIILTQGFQQPYNFYLQQILNIPAGWSGVSSYVNPVSKGVESIFAPYSADFIILASMTQFYYPETGVNTIGNWNYETGYKIKAENEFDVPMTGTKISNPHIDLTAGWNLIPVLSSCELPVADVFSGFAGLSMVKQVAGPLLYWPAYNINTLQTLVPGKAYFVASGTAGSVTFPVCTKTAINRWQDQKPQNYSPWNNPHYTASSHAIAIPSEVLSSAHIQPGDFIGIFTPEELCAGFAEITDPSSNAAITCFANDQTTIEKEGFEPGEMMQFRLFRPQENEETGMEVVFDPALPNTGLFSDHGLSAIKQIVLKAAGESELENIVCEIYPNPSKGNFIIGMSYWPENLAIEVLDINGKMIKAFQPGNRLNGSSYQLNLTNLPKGVYLLKLSDTNFLEMKKIVID